MRSSPRRLPAISSTTLLHSRPDLWDLVFPATPARARFVVDTVRRAGKDVLDVGCATGTLCAELAGAGLRPVGVDLNPRFVAAAKAKYPALPFEVGDMRALRFRRRFDALVCLGTTFLYNLENAELLQTLRAFRRALRPGGLLLLDVVNAIAFIDARRFERVRRHRFRAKGFDATATVHHEVHPESQTFTKQVTWAIRGERPRRDAKTHFRLLFPQEARHLLEQSGFGELSLLGGFDRRAKALDGMRLVVLARRVERSAKVSRAGG